jgi:hypothetical protein
MDKQECKEIEIEKIEELKNSGELKERKRSFK